MDTSDYIKNHDASSRSEHWNWSRIGVMRSPEAQRRTHPLMIRNENRDCPRSARPASVSSCRRAAAAPVFEVTLVKTAAGRRHTADLKLAPVEIGATCTERP